METNPYQSPTATMTVAPPLAPAAGVRPTMLTVLGIMNILLGVLGSFGLMMAAAMLAMPRVFQIGGPNPVLDAMQASGPYRTFTIVATVLGLLSIIVLIVSGIGLLQMRRYGRTLALGYSVYALLAGVVGLIVNVAFVFAPMMQNLQGLPAPQRVGAIAGMAGGVIGGAVGLVYPAILLYCMYRPSVVKALRP